MQKKGKIETLNNKISSEFIAEVLNSDSGNLIKHQLLENPVIKSMYFNKAGLFYYKQKNYVKALEQFKKSLRIAEQLGDLNKKVIYLNNIGGIYKLLGNNCEALKAFKSIIQISKQLGNLLLKATYLNRIGLIHHEQGDKYKIKERYPEALEQFKQAMKQYKKVLQITEQLGSLQMKIICLNNIAGIYNAQGNYPKALIQYEKALKILDSLGLNKTKNIKIIKNNINSIKKIMKKENNSN
ncbi:MAG: tetratricopeptide repeat protein [Promethearchaeota archaeon]